MALKIKLSRSQIVEVIEEWVLNEKYRTILLRRFLDGITLEALSEEVDMSVRQVKNIVKSGEDIIHEHFNN